MTNELKQEYLELYNAMELLDESDMISDVIYRAIAFKLLRTIMGHFAVECNKTKDASSTGSENEDNKYQIKVVTHGNCMICGKELSDGVFFCKECEEKAEREGVGGEDDE